MYNSGSVTSIGNNFYDGKFSGDIISVNNIINLTGIPTKYDLGYSGSSDNWRINSYTVSNSGVITNLDRMSVNENNTGIGSANIMSNSVVDSIGYQMYGGYMYASNGNKAIRYESFSINPSTGHFSNSKYLEISGEYEYNPVGYYGPNISMIITYKDGPRYKYSINKNDSRISSASKPPYYYAKTGTFTLDENGNELIGSVYGYEGNYNTVVYDTSINRFTYTCNINVSYDDSSESANIAITDKTPVVYMDDVVHYLNGTFIKFNRMSNGFSYPSKSIRLNFYIDDKSRIYKCNIPLIEGDSASAYNMYELSLD